MMARHPLVDFRPEIQARLKAAIPTYWPTLGQLIDRYVDRPGPEVLLPLASCQAAGGEPEAAVPVAAAILAAELSLIVLDDVYDQDRVDALFRQVGPARACNFGLVFQTLAFRVLGDAVLAPAARARIERAVTDGFLEMAAGQDRDLAGIGADLDAYWGVAERKTGAGYGMAMAAGALVQTDDAALVGTLRRFGYHLGLAVQIFNDLRGVWFPRDTSDLEHGKLTLPLIYAQSFEHPDRALLEAIVKDGQIARHRETIRQVLDRVDTRGFMVWAALHQRDKALAALDPIEPGPGKAFLDDFVTGCFGNIDALLPKSEAPTPVGTGVARAVIDRDAPPALEPTPAAEPPSYRSAALALRRSLREAF